MPLENVSYPAWALACYEARIKPLLDSRRRKLLPGVRTDSWLDTCEPGPVGAGQYRLFPGSLFLLWVEALQGRVVPSGAEHIAGAIELAHNASLVHDDVLDHHESRRNSSTLLATHGIGNAVMAGSWLLAEASSLLSEVEPQRLRGCLTRLTDAVGAMTAGQVLDEPEQWARVTLERRTEHWYAVCRGKLAIGNVAGPIAAWFVGREDSERSVARLIEEFSVVSQVLNDFGDILGFAGYHVANRTIRDGSEEAKIKPTLPQIWNGCEGRPKAEELPALIQRAQNFIAQRKRQALQRLDRLPVTGEPKAMLQDFFRRPAMPDWSLSELDAEAVQ